MFLILFINVYKGQTKGKDQNIFNFAWFRKFHVDAEVASFEKGYTYNQKTSEFCQN